MKISKNMKKSSINNIEIDKLNVMKQINENGQYKDDNIFIKIYQIEEEKEKEKQNQNFYLANITKNNSSFIGILNDQFKREGYGFNKFENNDKYLGNFENDKLHKNGIYIWPPESKDSNILTECYLGNWKENKKEGIGIYIFLSEPNNNKILDAANLEAFIGEFEDDIYKRGTYIIKDNNDYYLYHGNFDKEGRKNDENAFFYSSSKSTLIHGKISKDIFRNGYIFEFDSESGSIKEMAYCKFDKNSNLIDSTYKNDLPKEDKEKEEKIICNFRNIILNGVYLRFIYDKFKEVNNFINEEINNIDAFENKEKLEKINNICNDYNSNDIYTQIENSIFNENSFSK